MLGQEVASSLDDAGVVLKTKPIKTSIQQPVRKQINIIDRVFGVPNFNIGNKKLYED